MSQVQDIRYRLLIRYDTKLAPRSADNPDPKHIYTENSIAVGIWRGQVICFSCCYMDTGIHVPGPFGKCGRPIEGWDWRYPIYHGTYRYPNRERLAAWEALRAAIDNGTATFDPYQVTKRYNVLNCQGNSFEAKMCRAYVLSFKLPDLPAACRDIIDNFARK